MRILITGGAGFIGSHLCDRLLADGHTVIAMDNLSTGTTDNIAHLAGHERFGFVKHDVTNYIFVEGPVDAVLHLASLPSPVRQGWSHQPKQAAAMLQQPKEFPQPQLDFAFGLSILKPDSISVSTKSREEPSRWRALLSSTITRTPWASISLSPSRATASILPRERVVPGPGARRPARQWSCQCRQNAH